MFGKAFDDISINDIKMMVAERIPEGRRLEFKRDHYGRNDEAKREFAADISALANAVGGFLLIGIEEQNGIAASLVGIEAPNSDALVLAVVESARNSVEPSILGFRARWVAMEEADKGVLVIQVDRSWNGPHRVTVGRDYRFFIRDENGKHPMAVSELRNAFLFASEVDERVRQFRKNRLDILLADEGPLALDLAEPTLILHVVPQVTLTEGVQLQFDPNERGIAPLGGRGWNEMYSLDGIVTYTGPEGGTEAVRAFSTLFRNGFFEAVARASAQGHEGRRLISLDGLETVIIDGVQGVLKNLQDRSIYFPYYILISLIGVRGLSVPTNRMFHEFAPPHRSDRVLLPVLMVDHERVNEPVESLLHPLFDLMWNAFGLSRSPNYGTDGQYYTR